MEDTAIKEAKSIESAGEAVLYELGYHLIPTIAGEDMDGAVSGVREILEKGGASIVSEEYPKQIQLAYPISKEVGGKRTSFSSAYFGWIRFESTPRVAEKILSTFGDSQSVLRFIIVKAPKKAPVQAKPHRSVLAKGVDFMGKEEKPEEIEEAPKEEVIDEEIEKLIAE